jgi:GT2 family glycosyltransferase
VHQPEVTVVTATRNRRDLLARALRSIARQTFQNYEAVVVDDGSAEDARAEYPRLFAELGPRFRLLTPTAAGETGSGPGTSRNRGIHAARGTFVAFLDDDDEWSWPDYLETATGALRSSGADVFAADIAGYRGDELVIRSWFEASRSLLVSGPGVDGRADIHAVTTSDFLAAALKRTPHPDAIVARRDLVERTAGFPEDIRFGEDLGFVLRLLDEAQQVLFCDHVCTRYRLPTGDSISLQRTRFEQMLDEVMVVQRVGMSARTRQVRRTARRMQAWGLSQLSQHGALNGRRMTAVSLALQALAVYPTLGGLVRFSRTLLPGRHEARA